MTRQLGNHSCYGLSPERCSRGERQTLIIRPSEPSLDINYLFSPASSPDLSQSSAPEVDRGLSRVMPSESFLSFHLPHSLHASLSFFLDRDAKWINRGGNLLAREGQFGDEEALSPLTASNSKSNASVTLASHSSPLKPLKRQPSLG